MDVDVGLRSLELEDMIVDQGAPIPSSHHFEACPRCSSRSATADSTASSGTASPSEQRDLVRVRYTRVSTDSPEFMTKYEGIDQTVNVELSTIKRHAHACQCSRRLRLDHDHVRSGR